MSSTDPHLHEQESEREFYLAEFRGRSIGFAWPSGMGPKDGQERQPFSNLLQELVANGTRVVLLSPDSEVLEMAQALAGEGAASDLELPPAVGAFDPKPWAPRLWRSLREHGCAGLRLPAANFEASCESVAVALRLAKVVWIQSTPPVYRSDARSEASASNRVSVVDLAHLDPLLDPESFSGRREDELGLRARPECKAQLEAIRAMIRGGVPSVNVCAAEDITKELLTYAGAGIFFTRDRYAEVRPLALEDYDRANGLIARGEEDGFLLPRDDESRDQVLAHGVGLFIEGRYLAGIGALLPYAAVDAGSGEEVRALEIVSLYALTRYSGEGVGSQIVRFAIGHARSEGFDYAFSCTTSERVAEFFGRNGFERVGPEALPPSKWSGYDEDRRERVICLRFDCSAELSSEAFEF